MFDIFFLYIIFCFDLQIVSTERRLQYQNIGLDEATDLAEFFQSDKTIKVADLRWNSICTNGVILIANALWRNKTLLTLKYVVLGNNESDLTNGLCCGTTSVWTVM